MECQKVIIGFTFTMLDNWLKNLHHLFIQPEVTPTSIMTMSQTFSHTLHQLHIIALSFDWFIVLSVSFVID